MEVGSPQIPAGNPTHGTQVGTASLRLTPTGLSPSMASHSRELRLRRVGMHIGAHFQLHIPLPFQRGVRFELCRFHSPLLTASRLISFPAPTKMFQFGAFPLPQPKLTGAPDGRNSHSGILGSTAPCAYPRLFAAWHALLRRPEPSHPPGGITPAASSLSTSPVDVGAVKCL